MLYLELYFHHTLAIKCTLYIFTQNGHDSCSVLQGMLKRLLKQVTLRHLLNTNYSVFPPFYVFRGQQFTTTMQIKCLGLNKKKNICQWFFICFETAYSLCDIIEQYRQITQEWTVDILDTLFPFEQHTILAPFLYIYTCTSHCLSGDDLNCWISWGRNM